MSNYKSVEQKIEEIKSNIKTVYSTISGKGGSSTVQENQTSENLIEYLDTVPVSKIQMLPTVPTSLMIWLDGDSNRRPSSLSNAISGPKMLIIILKQWKV